MITYPQGWETYRVIDVADLFDNLRIPVTKNQRRPGKTPYYGANGIQDYVDGYTHDGEFVLIAEDGANDLLNYPVTYAKGKIWVNNHAHVISAKESVAVTKFLYYLLKKVDYTTFLVGGTRAKLNGKTFKNIEITIPSNTSEQKAISSILSDLDNHIDNLGKLIEKKKNIRDGALEDLMSGRTKLNGFSGEWQESKLADICKVYDGTHQTPKYTLKGIRFVSVEDISNLYQSDKFISKEAYDLNFKVRPEMGDILMTRIGDIGTPCVVDKSEPLAFYVSLALLKNISINNRFLYYYIMASAFQQELDDRTLHHATPKKINKGEIGKCNVKYPKDPNEQEAIASILIAMDKEIKSLEAEREKMIQIREGAMDDLLTGRVRLTV
jgi:type I restriction enzyme S subunit